MNSTSSFSFNRWLRAVQRWMASPALHGEAHLKGRVDLLNLIILISLAITSLSILAILLGNNVRTRTLVIVVLWLIVLLQSWHLLRSGNLDLVELILIIVFFIAITAANISQGSIRSTTTSIYVLWVALVVTLYRLPGLVIGTCISSLTVLGLIWAENARLLPQPDLSVGVRPWIILTGLFALNAGLAYYTNQITRRALASAENEIEHRKLSDEALRISEKRHRLLADNARDVIWTMAPDGAITYVSPAVEKLRGFTPAEAMVQTIQEILTPASQVVSTGYFTQLHADLAAGRPTASFRGELEYRCKDGSTVWTEVMAFPLFNSECLVEVLGVTRDISEHKRLIFDLENAKDAIAIANQSLLVANGELARTATTDTLTGVWNRRHFEEVARSALAQAMRYQQPWSLLIFDIDHFKAINDRHGHQIGDLVLIELTQLVGRVLRDADVLARWGGEEFVVIVPQCRDTEALALAQKLRELVEAHHFGDVGAVTISLGATQCRQDDDLEKWFRRADIALYKAKTSGRNAVRLGV